MRTILFHDSGKVRDFSRKTHGKLVHLILPGNGVLARKVLIAWAKIPFFAREGGKP